jgi:hypothetical protein
MKIRSGLCVIFANLSVVIGCNRDDGAKPIAGNVVRPDGSSSSGDNAVSKFDQAIRLNPTDAWAYYARAGAWLNKGKYDKALSDYDEALRLDPNNARFINDRGFTWHMKGNDDKALSDYAEAIRLVLPVLGAGPGEDGPEARHQFPVLLDGVQHHVLRPVQVQDQPGP